MLRHTGNFGRRDLASDEIIRLVKERFRICKYLFRLGAIWIAAGAVLICGFAFSAREDEFGEAALNVELIGFAIFAAAFALTLAIYRCPVCDKYLSRFRADKFRCPRCGAQIKESA
jgi:ssDNA-binding Zn-finger/Zn-ribbon topoisomerase 1